ncbi:hypothetical protein DFJ63DRAFT_313857 [Scheffersomyces coipomensis]|uniref:uncharacterized protein n=1 Tax=Scheffersomyces coipomensis TaxID=1788519 RepID=UPI00315DD003
MVKFDRLKVYNFVTSFRFKFTVYFLLVASLIIGSVVYTTSFNGATCAYVKIEEGAASLAEVAVRLNVLEVNENYDATTLKFPVLIFKHSDRENFTNIPTLDDFRKYYESDDIEFGDDLIDSDHKFRLDVAEGKTLNEDELYNDYLMLYNSTLKGKPHMRASFKVKRSGLYCAYIATPAIDGPKRALLLGIAFKNSFGDLSYYAHLLSSQMKYFFGIGIVIAVYFQFYTLRFRNERDSYFSSKSISSVSLSIIRLFTLKAFLDIFQLIGLNTSNHEILSISLLSIFVMYNTILEIYIYSGVLDVALGYGTIVAINNKSHFNEPIVMKYTALTSITIFVTLSGMVNYGGPNLFSNSYSARFFSNKTMDLLFISAQLLPIVWKVLILASFRRTKKAMLNNNDIQYLKPLKHSLAFLIVSPIIFTALTSFVFNTSFIQVLLFNPLYDIPATIMRLRVVYFDLVNTSVSEVIRFDPNLNLASMWSQYLTFYANAIFLFVMWVKNNKGLLYVVEDVEAKYEPLDGDVKEEEENEE